MEGCSQFSQTCIICSRFAGVYQLALTCIVECTAYVMSMGLTARPVTQSILAENGRRQHCACVATSDCDGCSEGLGLGSVFSENKPTKDQIQVVQKTGQVQFCK